MSYDASKACKPLHSHFLLTNITGKPVYSDPHNSFAKRNHSVYRYTSKNMQTQTHRHTCFRIPAAISWPQSKMMWNSFPLFISFKSGLASLVSAGSCRIFNRMLYRDGAFISSCNRIRPVEKYTKENTVIWYFFLPGESLLFEKWAQLQSIQSCSHEGNTFQLRKCQDILCDNHSWCLWQFWCFKLERGYESCSDMYRFSLHF